MWSLSSLRKNTPTKPYYFFPQTIPTKPEPGNAVVETDKAVCMISTVDGTGNGPLRNESYTVGWIAALPHEAVAAKAALDNFHGRAPLTQSPHDRNLYVLGSVRGHNVVIASLPAGVIGTTAATTTAMHMLASFPTIKIGLMVGIGAGIPRIRKDRKTSKYRDLRNIRLGDVVVSQPGGTHGGVKQYDLGKALSTGEFEPSGFLNSPPRALLNAVGVLRQSHEGGESDMPNILNQILLNLDNAPHSYAYPGQEFDRLFEAEYHHPQDEETCDDCDEDKEVVRTDRRSTNPVLHCGVIASGNQVIKSPAVRDRLGNGCICFEMEAAGLMNDFPCLVIRGICDYADSHKNDAWQRYAAATAAACAKEILLNIPEVEVENERLAKEVMQAAQMVMEDVRENIRPLQEELHQKRKSEILNWLSEVSYTALKADFLSRWSDGTVQWLLVHPTFQTWINCENPTLLCTGIPGAGKTMASSVIIQHLISRYANDNVMVAFLYCNYTMRSKQTADDLLAALLRQFAESVGELHHSIKSLDEKCERKRRPNREELVEALSSIVKSFDRTFVVVDGLNECPQWDDDIRGGLVGTIRHLQERAPVSFLATSRDIPIILEEFQNDMTLEITARKEDVTKYLQSRKDVPRKAQKNIDLQLKVVRDIADAVDGMFLLAQLYFDSLKSKRTEADIEEALRKFREGPRGLKALTEAYDTAIARIGDQEEEDRNWAYKVLCWVSNAKRPLSPTELQHALAIRHGDRQINAKNFPDCAEIVSLCAGLVSINKESNTIQLVHHTTGEYFDSNTLSWMVYAPMDLAASCLMYLAFEEFASGMATDDKKFEERIGRNKFLRYAASNWGHHARESQKDLQENHMGLLQNFLQNRDLTFAASQARSARGYWTGYSQDSPRWLWSHTLAFFGLGEIFKHMLCFSESEVDFSDEESSMTPLALAASEGHEAVVKLLLELGPGRVELNSGIKFGHRTPFGQAVSNGHYAVTKLFTELGPQALDLNSNQHCRRQSPLSVAAQNGSYDVVRLLVSLGPGRVEVDSRDGFTKQTPLSHAVQNGHVKIAELLLSLGPQRVNPDSKDKFGNTPLIWAARNGHAELVSLLIDLGPEQVNANHTNRQGRTALQEAAMHSHCNVVRRLVSYPQWRVDVNISTPIFTQTALACAAENGLETVVRALIGLGPGRVDFDARGWRNMTPLLWAAKEGHVEIIKLLADLEPGSVDTNAVDVDGFTPLIWAVVNEHFDAAQFLVGLGLERVDTNIADKKTFTALDYAARRGRRFENLLRSGENGERKQRASAEERHSKTGSMSGLFWTNSSLTQR